MSENVTTTELEREHARFAAAAERALAAEQDRAHDLELALAAATQELAEARYEILAIHQAGHIPAEEGHRLSRFLFRAGRRAKTAGL